MKNKPFSISQSMALAIVLFVASVSYHPARAVVFPVLTEARITSCKSDPINGPCSAQVLYAGNVSMLEIGVPTTKPLPDVKLDTLGIHCHGPAGGSLGPFKVCKWQGRGAVHSPVMSNCELQSTSGDDWTIKDPAGCSFAKTWGPHIGAGPGGECAVFGQKINDDTVLTPFGIIDAVTAANAGSTFCIKPLPPASRCEVNLSPTLSHGEVRPNSTSSATIHGTTDCGYSPKVTIIGGSDLELAPGIKTHLDVTAAKNEIMVSSEMTTYGAMPGQYEGNAIIVVNPH